MNSFIQKLKGQNKTYILMTVAVLAAALFFVFRIIYAGILALPYPKEILEPSNIALTNEFMGGYGPYSEESLIRSTPGINYDYPPLGSLVAALIAKIAGCTAVTAHFAISLFSILASGAIGYAMVKRACAGKETYGKSSGSALAAVFAALIFMFCHFRYGYISAAPDDLAQLLMLLTCLAAVSPKIKNKPVVCAFGITLCFYTKQYFVFVAAGLFIYMLTYSVRDAIKLLVWTLVINILTGALVTFLWPLYWTKAFFFTYLGTAVGGGGQMSTLIDQFIYLLAIFGPLFAVIILAAARGVIIMTKDRKWKNTRKDRENDAFSMAAVQMMVMIVPLFIIARNDGAFLSYFLQLWMPFVTIVALVCLERMRPQIFTRDGSAGSVNVRTVIYTCVYAFIIVFTIYFGFTKLPLHILTDEEISDWQKAYSYTQKYGVQGELYLARSLAYTPVPNAGTGDLPANFFGSDCICGHDGEVSEDTIGALTKAGLPGVLMQYARQIVDQNLAYRYEIEGKAADHTYSLITFDDSGAYTPFSDKICEKYGYVLIDRLRLQLGNMPYDVLFYAAPEMN